MNKRGVYLPTCFALVEENAYSEMVWLMKSVDIKKVSREFCKAYPRAPPPKQQDNY